MMPQGVTVDANDVAESLLRIISAQALQIAKLEALNKQLAKELAGREEKSRE